MKILRQKLYARKDYEGLSEAAAKDLREERNKIAKKLAEKRKDINKGGLAGAADRYLKFKGDDKKNVDEKIKKYIEKRRAEELEPLRHKMKDKATEIGKQIRADDVAGKYKPSYYWKRAGLVGAGLVGLYGAKKYYDYKKEQKENKNNQEV